MARRGYHTAMAGLRGGLCARAELQRGNKQSFQLSTPHTTVVPRPQSYDFS